MPEEVLFKTEQRLDRAEIADYLRTVAGKLDGDGALTLSSGDESVSMDPPASLEFEVKAEREGEELSLEFELEWVPGEDGERGGLDIS